MRYYHGGVPGLRAGGTIAPPDTTGTDHRLSAYAPPDAPHGTRTDVVYLTPDRTVARCYAAMYPDGALYEVVPDGPTEPDPDAPHAAVMARSATIRAVVDPVVLLRSRSPEAWLRTLVNRPGQDPRP